MTQYIVDVSEHNGDIDWQQVKDGGYHAIIRAGFGRFDSGGRLDYKFERNVSECDRLGIPYGLYWYSYASSEESARIEGQQMVDAANSCNPSYPLYFDTEESGTQSVSEANLNAFASVVEDAGYWCGVYASESWFNENISAETQSKYTLWVAKWSDTQPSVSGNVDLWQNRGGDADNYSYRANVSGIGWSDMNVLLRDTLLSEVGRWDKSEDETPAQTVCPTCGQPIPIHEDGDGSDTPADAPTDTAEETSGLSYQQRAAEVMYHMCTHDGNGGHGYSQYNRWGDGTNETIMLSDGSQVSIPNGDFDCSSAVITAWEAVLPGCSGDATYTGNMIEGFTSSGLFRWYNWDDDFELTTGDILLNTVHHTAMCIANDFTLAQFSISENYSIGGQQGDQTGWESNVKPYFWYTYGWDGILRYIGDNPSGTVTPGAIDTNSLSLDVDGYWGPATITALQQHFGTTVDGVVSHQWAGTSSDKTDCCQSGWEWDYTAIGSDLIRAMQRELGVDVDGLCGTQTITALQAHYGTPQDGVLSAGSPCVQAMQTALNSGTF